MFISSTNEEGDLVLFIYFYRQPTASSSAPAPCSESVSSGPSMPVVYCDGCCYNHGSRVKAGVGVFWGPKSS